MLSDQRREKNKDNLGAELKTARTNAGFTQKALAEVLGLEYYTMISQMELGYISIHSSLWLSIALQLNIDPHLWVLRCLHEYQPDIYAAIFRHRSLKESADVLKMYHLGKLDDLITDFKLEDPKE